MAKSSTNLIGWQVQARFIIEVHVKDLDLIYKIQTFFGGIGSVTFNKKVARYSIQGIKDILNIVNHFDRYPLQSYKQIDFAFWKKCINIILNKKHLTSQGLEEILSYKNSMNRGQSEKLKLSFPNITITNKPVVEINDQSLAQKLNPFWITGFIIGEGSFYINFYKNTNKMWPVFSIGLNERDRFLLIRINNFFFCEATKRVSIHVT